MKYFIVKFSNDYSDIHTVAFESEKSVSELENEIKQLQKGSNLNKKNKMFGMDISARKKYLVSTIDDFWLAHLNKN